MARWASSLITVSSRRQYEIRVKYELLILFFYFLGVDACNTGLSVLVFAAATNMGQSWMTFIALFGCKLSLPIPFRT